MIGVKHVDEHVLAAVNGLDIDGSQWPELNHRLSYLISVVHRRDPRFRCSAACSFRWPHNFAFTTSAIFASCRRRSDPDFRES